MLNLKDFDEIDQQAEHEARALTKMRQRSNCHYKRIRQALNYNKAELDKLFSTK